VARNPLAPDWLAEPVDPNALDPAVWPASAARDADGLLQLGGVDVRALQERFGTPLYVVDEDDARARARTLREAFEREATAAVKRWRFQPVAEATTTRRTISFQQ
jgi:diaminopimelate decarboxylase